MNGASVCLEEIALEGLDGITLSTLWKRMKSATMWSNFDENYKEFLWRCIASCQDIQAYLLDKPRDEILDFADDSGIYPYCCVNESGVRGSCSTMKTRKLVNVSNLGLQTVVEMHGNRLVLVAAQLLRNKVLFGPEFDVSIKIPDAFYCLLEIIGRGRKLGRLHSQLGIQTLADSRTLFSQVKTLLKLQLITKQSVYSKIKMAPTSIIYLSRYHIEHGNDSIQFKISEALYEAPERHMALSVLCLQLEEKFEILEKVVEDLSKSGHVCYIEDARNESDNGSTHSTDTQALHEGRKSKVVQFAQHFYNLCNETDVEFEDEEWAQPDYQELSVSLPAEVPIMHAIYNFVKSKGKDGASLSQCCQELSMPFFKMRRVLKDLENLQMLFSKFEDLGNTKKNQYFARSPVTQGEIRLCQNTQITKPPATRPTHSLDIPSSQPQTMQIQTMQSPGVEMIHLPTIEATHSPATQLCQPSRCQTTSSLSNHIIQAETSAAQMLEIDAASISQINKIHSSHNVQVCNASHTAITQGSAVGNTQSPTIRNTQQSATQITSSELSQALHPSPSQTVKSDTSQNKLMPTIQTDMKFLKEDASVHDPMQLSTNPFSANNTTEQTQGSVNSRSQKLINTERSIRRKETILNALKNLKVVEGENVFTKTIRMEENKMGLNISIDRKTVLFLLDKLTAGGLLNRVEMNVKVENEEHKVTFFCDKNIQQDGEEMATCIQKFKDRMIYQKAKRSGVFSNKTNPKSSFLPKMPRCELLHIFLFYIIYELSNPNADLEAWRRKYDWAEFLKPEHSPRSIGKGWFTPYSILMLLPVSLYCKLVGNAYQNNTVQKYFANPATRHMLLKDLPPLARQGIVVRRKNYFLFGTFEFLACFGLITPSNKQVFFHERDIACYLHTSTVLKDTCSSEPAYENVQHPDGGDFPERVFTFFGLSDVEQYWSMVRKVCMATPLNRRKFQRSQKKPNFKIDLQSLIVDETQIPTCSKPLGNGLGVAGFDSRMYCHLSQKWRWSLKEKRELGSDVEDSLDWNLCFANDDLLSKGISVSSGMKKTKEKRKKPIQDETPRKKRKVTNGSEKKTEASQNVAGSSSQNVAESSLASPSTSSNRSKDLSKLKKKRERRKRKRKKAEQQPSPKTKRTGHWSIAIHDKRDEEALKQLQEKRTTFTPQQQKLLFICCVALRILGKRSTDTGYSDWLWTRDILYKDNYESAKTKTALSISRKYRSMIKNAQTRRNLNICVADCMQENDFQPYCNLQKSCTEVMFNELVELLKKKYSMESTVTNHLVLPSTMQEFQQQKSLYNSLEVENPDTSDDEILLLEPRETSIADVRQRIIRDSIVSALLLANEEYQSHVAFKFLSQFTEEELIIAISVLKNRRILVRKKLRHSLGHELTSCAFSQMLSSMGYYTIDNHFSGTLLDDAKSFYDEIKCNSSPDDDEKSEQSLTLKFSKNSIIGGHVYCIFSLLTCNRLAVSMEVPENILAMEKKPKPKVSTPVPESLNEERSHEINNATIEREHFSVPNIASTSVETSPPETGCETLESEVCGNTRTNGDVSQSLITMSDVETHKDPVVKRTVEQENNDVDHVTAIQTTQQTTVVQSEEVDKTLTEESRITTPGNINRRRSLDLVFDVLCGIEDHLFGSQALEANMPLYKVKLKPTSTLTCIVTTSDVNSVRMSCNGDLIGNIETSRLQNNNRAYESYLEKIATYRSTGDLNKIQFGINPCVVEIRLLSVPEQEPTPKEKTLAQTVACYFKSSGLGMPSTIDECMSICSKMFGYTTEDCDALRTVYETINSGKELGLSSSHVDKLIRRRPSIGNFSTDGLIKVLEAFNLVYQVGFVEVCYVTKAFKEHWFLTYRKSDFRSSSEVEKFEEPGKNSGKRKRCNLQSVEDEDIRSKSIVAEESERLKNSDMSDETVLSSDDITSRAVQQRTEAAETRCISKESGRDASVDLNNSSSEDDNFGKQKHFQISIQTQTESCSSKPSRPWITMAGEMNKNAYNTLHRSVLGYIVKYPGVQKYAVTKHFLNLMFPVATEEVLQKLEECECIKQHVCYVKKMTLFSSRAGKKTSYYLPKADAMFKLIERVFL